MNAQQHFNIIAAIDLEPIRKKLMHGPSGEGWTLAKAEAVEREYRRFLYLMKAFPGHQAAPLLDVDTFWHYHILDTVKYMADCDTVFGYYLHHYPYAGLEGTDNDEEVHEAAGRRMQELYDSVFGEGTFVQAAQALETQAAWCLEPPATSPAGARGQDTDTVALSWCVGRFTAAGAQGGEKSFAPAAAAVAWCLEPPRVSAAGKAALPVQAAKMAWCLEPPRVTAAKPALAQKPAAQTAWCLEPPRVTAGKPALPQKRAVQTAWCLEPPREPSAVAQAALA